jgi:hypothetical protein
MTTPVDPETLKRLQKIPNVGPAISRDLAGLGIARVEDLRGRDPDDLFHELCRQDGVCPDPCMHDVLTAVVAFANGEPSRPWWEFTPARKARTTAIAPPELIDR